MADDLLERILKEVRERQEAARAAYEESRRLHAALEALGPGTGGEDPGATAEESSGPTGETPDDLEPDAGAGEDEDGTDAGESGGATSP